MDLIGVGIIAAVLYAVTTANSASSTPQISISEENDVLVAYLNSTLAEDHDEVCEGLAALALEEADA